LLDGAEGAAGRAGFVGLDVASAVLKMELKQIPAPAPMSAVAMAFCHQLTSRLALVTMKSAATTNATAGRSTLSSTASSLRIIARTDRNPALTLAVTTGRKWLRAT